MTVLLMLTMFVVFLTIDYFMRRGRVTTVETEVEMTATPASLRALSAIVGGFQLAENRRYHPGAHSGVRGKRHTRARWN